MAGQVSLMDYLQHGPPELPVIEQGQSPENTRNRRYNALHINNVGHWAGFNLATIQQEFGGILAAAQIQDELFQPSPPRPINSESAVRSRVDAYLTNRIIRALRCGFEYMSSTGRLTGFTILHYDVGMMATLIEDYTPDFAFFDPILEARTRPNRVPGDVKPSYKWSLALQNDNNPRYRREFKQLLSQVNFYMKQHDTRYGFILTDCELVAIRRLDGHGNLELSVSIPWSAAGTPAEPKLTVLLGLWYLGMLAANGENWRL